MSSTSSPHRLAALLAPVVTGTGLELDGVEITSAGRRRHLRVLVDKDGGVSLDDVALVSRSISQLLDAAPEADAVLGSAPYVLEVTSPGVDRPLTEPRHWRRAHGHLVTASLRSGGAVTGRVVAAEPDGVRLDTEARAGRWLPYADIATARVQVEFNRPGAGVDDEESR